MRILKIIIIEFLLRGIPEAMMLNLGLYTFANMVVNKRQFFVGVLMVAALQIPIMLLPITYGLHTPIIMIVIIILFQKIHKVDMMVATRCGIISITIEMICEIINIGVIKLFSNRALSEIFSNPIHKVIYELPSVILSNIILIGIYIWLKKQQKLKVPNNAKYK